jgi:hypothetical protein
MLPSFPVNYTIVADEFSHGIKNKTGSQKLPAMPMIVDNRFSYLFNQKRIKTISQLDIVTVVVIITTITPAGPVRWQYWI